MPKSSKQAAYLCAITVKRSSENFSEEKQQSSDGDEDRGSDINFSDKVHLPNIRDLLEMCLSDGSSRNIDVSMYFVLRHFNANRHTADDFLKRIRCLSCEYAHKWCEIFLNDDFADFNKDNPDGKHSESVFDLYPKLEV
ncbi:unnamed protein product, partial [Didymodactylos carnosus]